MKRASILFSLVLFLTAAFVKPAAAPAHAAQSESLAAAPPMGWNSWDAYGEAVSESDIRQSAQFMADHLKSYGWQYVVIDMGWYVTNHSVGINAEKAQFSLDSFGRFTPAVNTIPSAAGNAGFKPLADYIHSLGLKIGIHILRGIPKEAVAKNLPIEGSAFHAADAANPSDTCPWNPFNYGLDTSKPAAQAYYDSIARLYASWGIDFLKVDCISSHPYKGDEIRVLSTALRKTGRPIVLSLSPGPAPLEKAEEMGQYANLWRISDDVWDVWRTTTDFPQGPANQFARAAKWAPYSRPGNWPDADMLPIGTLKPTPGWGDPRQTRLSHDEQRTLLTLWSIFRSPLILGSNLPALKDDPWTLALLTNREVIDVDQHSTDNRAVISTDSKAVWLARPVTGAGYYLAVFNLDDKPQSFHFSWSEVGLSASQYTLRDLWEHKDLPSASSLDVTLPAHASVLYKALPQ